MGIIQKQKKDGVQIVNVTNCDQASSMAKHNINEFHYPDKAY